MRSFPRRSAASARTARVAVGARAWAETVLELRRALPDAELLEGSTLVNELRRVKSAAELELMARGCTLAREAMAATTRESRRA